ncbi:MAG: sodium:solute symporter [Pirellulaceae bacterium]
MGVIDYLVLLLYFGGMIGIGVWSMGRIEKHEDYFMGGRGFGKIMQTFAAFGAGTGAHEPVTVGRTGWTSGLSGVWSALMWLFVTPVYWITAPWYRRMRHLTLGDWFVERYQSKSLGVAYTIFAITFYMFYLSTMLSAIAKFAAPLLGYDTLLGLELKFVLIPALALIVIVYGVLGGLTAAYYTDLVQGIFIILLSILLIPFGLLALVNRFGNPATMGMWDGLAILHERIPPDYFSLFSGPSSGEFPIQYIISLSILGLVTIVVQPHFIATGGGTAKTEDDARIGLVVGNFLKRLCTVGWALTALIALALLADNVEIALDPDRVWGVAAREILGPMNLGLVGLMLACLIAAMMSSADAYMLVTSALVTKNVYAAYIDEDAEEKTYINVGRLTGLIIIVGASVVAIFMSSVFDQFKLAIELPILFAAPFWIGMYWRRANTSAVWITFAFSLVLFFLLPVGLPTLAPSLRESTLFSAQTNKTTTTIRRDATAADVAKSDAWTKAKGEIENSSETPARQAELIKALGPEPPECRVGQDIFVVTKSGGVPIFWSGPLEPIGPTEIQQLSANETPEAKVVTEKAIGVFRGSGNLKVDFAIYSLLGIDLQNASKATLETLRLPTRVLLPFLIFIVVSFLTPRNEAKALDRYYAKMHTEVDADPEADRLKLTQAYRNPHQYESQRLFPGTDLEIMKPRAKDVVGFAICVGICAAIIWLLLILASLGA